MRTGTFVSKAVMLNAVAAFCAASAVSAADTVQQPESGQAGITTGTQSSARVRTKLAAQFSSFAGSEDNAQNLITGLRNGEPITLATAAAPGQPSTALTIDTPTRPMGYGNVTISLGLAQQQLANLGITQPTPQQIQTALTGGTITTGSGTTARTVELSGILTLRSEGMGWGNIAKSQGMNLGQVMSSLKNHNPGVAGGGAVGGSAVAAGGTALDAKSASASRRGAGGENAQGEARLSSGIVTAAGNSVGAGAGMSARSEAGAGGAGVVTGLGASAAARGTSGSNGLAKGHFKP